MHLPVIIEAIFNLFFTCDRSSFDVTMLTTPMLMKTLDDIQQEARNKDKSAPYPDILQLISKKSSVVN